MADAGWPMFAEQRAREALPHYGGNKIPDSYLDKFNAETDAWLKRIGARSAEPQVDPAVPAHIAQIALEF